MGKDCSSRNFEREEFSVYAYHIFDDHVAGLSTQRRSLHLMGANMHGWINPKLVSAFARLMVLKEREERYECNTSEHGPVARFEPRAKKYH